MVSKITAGDTLDGNYGTIGLCFSRTEEGKSNFIVDWFGSRRFGVPWWWAGWPGGKGELTTSIYKTNLEILGHYAVSKLVYPKLVPLWIVQLWNRVKRKKVKWTKRGLTPHFQCMTKTHGAVWDPVWVTSQRWRRDDGMNLKWRVFGESWRIIVRFQPQGNTEGKRRYSCLPPFLHADHQLQRSLPFNWI